MTAEQAHGKSFERLVKDASGLFPAAENVTFGHIEEFDIPATHTPDAIPVSIKVKKNQQWAGKSPAIEMGDALRFYHNSTRAPMRIIAGLYEQEQYTLRFFEIHDLILEPSMAPWLWGDLDEQDLRDFIAHIHQWADNDDLAGRRTRYRARDLARRHKDSLLPRGGNVALNQKISSTNKRLQCSINIHHLRNICRQNNKTPRLVTDQDPDPRFGKLRLPLHLKPGGRTQRAR